MQEYIVRVEELRIRNVSGNEIESIINFEKITGLDGNINHTPSEEIPQNPDNI